MKNVKTLTTALIIAAVALLYASSAFATTTDSGYNDPVIRTEFDFTAELTSEGDVDMTWVPYAPEGFNYYKVVRSTTNNNPVYPEDGYIYFTSDAEASSYTDTEVPSGTVYYRVCSIASPDRYCSPVVTLTGTGSEEEDDELVTIVLSITELDNKAKLTWTTSGNVLHGFKILKSTTHAAPTYPVMEGDNYIYLSDSAVRSYQDADIEQGQIMYYRVCQYDGAGTCLSYSNGVSITISGTTETETFTDIAGNAYKNAITYVKNEGIVHGYGDNTYKPNSSIRRDEFTKVLIGAKFDATTIETCLETNNITSLFPDVPLNYDFADYICVAKVQGIIIGYEDGYFKPSNNISFVETAKIVAKTFTLTSSDSGQPWYTPYVYALQNSNFIPPTIYNLNQNVNRAEMAELIWRVRENITTQSSTDLLPIN